MNFTSIKPYAYVKGKTSPFEIEVTLKEEEESAEYMEPRDRIKEKVEKIKLLLLHKNEEYGNQLLEPDNTFSYVDRITRIESRLDEKISRIKHKRKQELMPHSNDIDDLIGLLIFYSIALEEE